MRNIRVLPHFLSLLLLVISLNHTKGNIYDCQAECHLTGEIVGDPNDCNRYYICYTPDNIIQSCPETTPYFDGENCQDDESLCCDLCTAYCNLNEVGTKIRDAYDCSAYYTCESEGIATDRIDCTNDMIFDLNSQGCVEGSCEPYCNSSAGITSTQISTIFDTTTQESTTQKLTTFEPTTELTSVDFTSLESTTTELTSENSAITDSTTEELTTEENTTEESTTEQSQTTTVAPFVNCDLSTICEGESDQSSVADPYDCHQYYNCQDQMPESQAQKCGSGTFYNITECVPETTPCLPQCANFCPTQCDLNVEYIPDSTDCSVFYHCNADLDEYSCTGERPYFNGEVCVDDPSDCCSVCIPYCTEDDAFQLIADPKDCRGYYFCDEFEGVPVNDRGSCEQDQYFNDQIRECRVGDCNDYCS